MTVFEYTAVDRRGSHLSGRIDTQSRDALASSLRDSGLFLLDASPRETPPIRAVRSLSKRELADLTERLEILVRAGIPLTEALAQLGNDSRRAKITRLSHDLYETVRSGRPLSEGLARHPRVFDDTYRAAILAGEESGALEDVLRSLAQRLTWSADVSSKVRSAFAYPAFLLLAIFGLMLLILLFLMPRIAGIFERTRTSPPAVTQAALAAKDFLVATWPVLSGAIAVGVFAFMAGLRSRPFRRAVQGTLFRLPWFGRIITMTESAVFVHTLALLNNAGVMLTRSLRICAGAMRTERIRDGVAEATALVERGQPLASSISAQGCFPPLVCQMLAAGESGGQLDSALGRVQAYLDREIPRAVGKLLAALGPALTIVSGALVAFAMISVMAPLLSVLQALRSGSR